jgi:hypothetical protein
MSRWGKPRKNVKRIDPRYFMDEKMEVIEEGFFGDMAAKAKGALGLGKKKEAPAAGAPDSQKLNLLWAAYASEVRKIVAALQSDPAQAKAAMAKLQPWHKKLQTVEQMINKGVIDDAGVMAVQDKAKKIMDMLSSGAADVAALSSLWKDLQGRATPSPESKKLQIAMDSGQGGRILGF